MEFDEIAKRLGMTEKEVIKIYKRALQKLKAPTPENQKFWEYVRINSDNKDRDGIISTE
jgi:DNA-directed RNA polymerase sigma subunit (sigma70/sigma32)